MKITRLSKNGGISVTKRHPAVTHIIIENGSGVHELPKELEVSEVPVRHDFWTYLDYLLLTFASEP